MEVKKLQDIKLDSSWQITKDVTGDFLRTTSDYECILQEIALEALTQEGELFYDEGFGWSLLDYLHSGNDEMQELEIGQRVKGKLSWYEEIDINSIKVAVLLGDENCKIQAAFKFVGSDEEYNLQLQLDRINAEVVILSD